MVELLSATRLKECKDHTRDLGDSFRPAKLMLGAGKAREVHPVLWVLAGLLVLYYAFVRVG